MLNQLKNKSFNHHYIDGQWIKGEGTCFDSINPANSDLIWQGKIATEKEVIQAVTAAHHALLNWSKKPFSSRAQQIEAFRKQIESKKTELTELIALETGKPVWEAQTETNAVIAKIPLSIQAYLERTSEKKIENIDATGYVRYKPHGVVAVLGPFNFPAHLSNGHIIPALLAGNTVVYKPSELTPAVAQFMVQCWNDSGLPAGVLNCIQGSAPCAKTLLTQNIQGVYFTGSYRTGLEIHRSFANRPEVILALEMGGNNPLLVDEVHNKGAALYNTVLSTLITAGQRCSCARRILVADNTDGDEFITQLIKLYKNIQIGKPFSRPEPFMGPVISYEHALSHLEAQKNLQRMGGQSLLPMKLMAENTGFLSPGIIDMSQVSNPPDEEVFAPFIQVYRYKNFEHALTLANQTQYGLTAGLLSDSEQRYQQFYENVHAGVINWNRPTTGASSCLPFGGIGHSGNHRPSAYFAADYCAYPIASLEQPVLSLGASLLPGINSKDFN